MIEVLEFFGYLRRTGTLSVESIDGEQGFCALADGQIVAAECGHRRGEEAALTLASWRQGSFEFTVGLISADESTAIPVAHVAMEAVRLEDELVRREAFLPSPTTTLTLASDSFCPDPIACGISEIIDEIRAQPGITRRRLEAESALCPAKVRLATAMLVHCRLTCTPQDQPDPEPQRPMPQAPSSACRRILIALESADLSSALPRVLAALADRLGAPSITPAASPESPTFARFRPAGTAIQSLIFLPIRRENRLLFENFLSTVDAVVLDVGSSAEGQRWQDDAGPIDSLQVIQSAENVVTHLDSLFVQAT